MVLPFALLTLVLLSSSVSARGVAPLALSTDVPSVEADLSARFIRKVVVPVGLLDRRQGISLPTGATSAQATGATGDTTAQDTTAQVTQDTTTTPAATSDTPTSATATTPTATSDSPTPSSTLPTTSDTPTSGTGTSAPSSTVPTSGSASDTSSVNPSSAASSGGTKSSAASSSAQSASVVVSTAVTVVTDANGSKTTSTGLSTSTALAGNKSEKSSSSTGKTWGIVGGVIGGVVVLAAIIFIVWKCTQRRFGNLDDDGDEPDGQTIAAGTSTLNPLGTRRTGRAGVEMSERDGMSDWGGEGEGGGSNADLAGAGLAGAQFGSRQSLYEPVQFSDAHAGLNQGPNPYYDPYLGPSAAPHPPPQVLYPPQTGAYPPSRGVGAPGLSYSTSSSSYHTSPALSSAPNSTSHASDLSVSGSSDPFASHADAYPIAPSSPEEAHQRRMSTVRESSEIRPESVASLYRNGSVIEEGPKRKLGVVNGDEDEDDDAGEAHPEVIDPHRVASPEWDAHNDRS
ncbi:hypothetical protein RQP46_008081 [Phenoliferia psychrophenolica]